MYTPIFSLYTRVHCSRSEERVFGRLHENIRQCNNNASYFKLTFNFSSVKKFQVFLFNRVQRSKADAITTDYKKLKCKK